MSDGNPFDHVQDDLLRHDADFNNGIISLHYDGSAVSNLKVCSLMRTAILKGSGSRGFGLCAILARIMSQSSSSVRSQIFHSEHFLKQLVEFIGTSQLLESNGPVVVLFLNSFDDEALRIINCPQLYDALNAFRVMVTDKILLRLTVRILKEMEQKQPVGGAEKNDKDSNTAAIVIDDGDKTSERSMRSTSNVSSSDLAPPTKRHESENRGDSVPLNTKELASGVQEWMKQKNDMQRTIEWSTPKALDGVEGVNSSIATKRDITEPNRIAESSKANKARVSFPTDSPAEPAVSRADSSPEDDSVGKKLLWAYVGRAPQLRDPQQVCDELNEHSQNSV